MFVNLPASAESGSLSQARSSRLTTDNSNSNFRRTKKTLKNNPIETELSNVQSQKAETEKIEPINYWIQFSFEGMCLAPSIDKYNSLIISFCNPNLDQSFYFDEGALKEKASQLCVGFENPISKKLLLVDCIGAIKLDFVEDRLIYTDKNTGETLCATPVVEGKRTSRPKQGTTVALTKCHTSASNVTLLEETQFLKDRSALILHPPDQSKNCVSGNSDTFNRPPMAQLLPAAEVTRCKSLPLCVTVVVKTARRPLLVVRLATSIRKVLGQDLPMIVIDDGPEEHPADVMEQVAQFKMIKYVVAEKDDLGISEGRMRGVNMVKTKYFVNMDDDNVVTDSWNAAKMAELLDTTDLSLVGARTDSLDWPGFMEFICDEKDQPRTLYHYVKSCRLANQTLPSYPACVRCDLSSNSFMAKTRDVIEVGGWSKELKVNEHHDLFLRLQAEGKKVVWCPGFHVLNVHGEETENNEEYRRLRYRREMRMKTMFFNHWNFGDYIRVKQEKRYSFSWLRDL